MFSLSALLTFSEWVGFLPFYKISRGFHAENPHVFANSFRKYFDIRVSNKTQAFFYTVPPSPPNSSPARRDPRRHLFTNSKRGSRGGLTPPA